MRQSETATGLSGRIGIGGIYLFAAFAWLSPSLATLGLTLSLAAFLAQLPRAGVVLARTPVFWALAACLLYLVIHGLIQAWINPAAAGTIAATSASHAKLLVLIIPVAWFLGANEHRILHTLVLAGLGLLGRLLFNTRWDDPVATFFGETHGFGMAQIGLSLYLATALLALALFLPRMIRRTADMPQRAVLLVLITLLILTFTQALIITQSRATWIAFLLVAPLTLLLFLRGTPRHRSPGMLIPAAFVIPLAIIMLFNVDAIQTRVIQESGVVSSILSMDRERVPANSLGLRYHANVHGMTLVRERPWWGRGAGGSDRLMETHYLPEARQLQHFHNTYLQITIEFGLAGLMLAVLTVMIMTVNITNLYRSGVVPRDLYFLLGGSTGMLLIWSASNFRLENFDMRAYCILLMACCLTYSLHRTAASSAELTTDRPRAEP